jgi:hypothetical protein
LIDAVLLFFHFLLLPFVPGPSAASKLNCSRQQAFYSDRFFAGSSQFLTHRRHPMASFFQGHQRSRSQAQQVREKGESPTN